MSCDFLIIGAGITGLTIARELIERGAEDILVIEKESSVGVHASGRNSGVLHAGIYYTPDSLRAKFCIEGNRLMKAYCRKMNLKLKESGKVIVARSEKELPVLFELKKRADLSGARTEIIDEKQLKEIEPYARTVDKALYSPETAVIDPVEVLNALVGEIRWGSKAKVLFNTRFITLKGSSAIRTNRGEIKFKKIINAGGAYAEKIAHEFGLAKKYKILPFKGTYREVRRERSNLVRGNVYPVPDINNPFLGIHFTRSVDDVVFIGPTAIPALGRENYGILRGIDFECFEILLRNVFMFLMNSSFRSAGAEEIKKYFTTCIYRDASALIPEIRVDDIIKSSKTGIRPQLVDLESKKLVMDFILLQDSNSIHILNAISPAFTSSMAFARLVVDRITSGVSQ